MGRGDVDQVSLLPGCCHRRRLQAGQIACPTRLTRDDGAPIHGGFAAASIGFDFCVSYDIISETQKVHIMVAEVIPLPSAEPLRTPIGQAIRTGESSYRQLENLHAEGRLPASTVVVDASKARFQREFIASLKDSGAEIILDTKCADPSGRS